MFRIFKNKENKIDITLEGEFEVTPPSMLEYDEWRIREEKRQLVQAIINKLDGIVPDNMSNTYHSNIASYAKLKIAEYLVYKEFK